MRLPSFLVIGTAKAGTTALFHYLRQHPDVFLSPRKEPRFFAFEGDSLDFHGPGADQVRQGIVTTLAEYGDLFRGAGDRRAVGEISPVYLYSEEAPRRIHGLLPRAKLIAILRDPAERAFSNWISKRGDGIEPLAEFGAALDAEEFRIREGWPYVYHYARRGYYGAQLGRYSRLFDRRRLKVLLYEDWQADNRKVLRDLFEFLEVDPSFVPDTAQRFNVSGVPRSRRLHDLVMGPSSARSCVFGRMPVSARRRLKAVVLRALVRRPRLATPDRARLVAGYRDDVRRLEELLDRDLSAWLAV